MPKEQKVCQSCSMPLNKDEKGGGSERDGTRSTLYCSHCYEDGSFTLPDLTLEEMRARVKTKMVEFGIPKFMTGLFVRNLHKLERWK